MTRSEPSVQVLPTTRSSIRWGRLAETLHLPTLLVLAVGLAVWSLMSDRYGAYLFPPPSRVLSGLLQARTGRVLIAPAPAPHAGWP
jgi:hypothetical protein